LSTEAANKQLLQSTLAQIKTTVIG